MSARDDLTKCRSEIAAIDGEIVQLLKKRLDVALKTGPLKRELGIPILDPSREATVIRTAVESARELGLPEEDVRDIFWHILKVSRTAQQEDK
jgi:chorismate mutase / prephenate dehydrogenase